MCAVVSGTVVDDRGAVAGDSVVVGYDTVVDGTVVVGRCDGGVVVSRGAVQVSVRLLVGVCCCKRYCC